MKMNSKNTPQLRFPGLTREWSFEKLGEVFDFRNGYTPSKNNPEYWIGGNIPWFRMEDIREKGNILSDSILHITPEAIKGAGLFKAYSIIIATSATIGEHALVKTDYLANQRFTNLFPKKKYEGKIDMMYAYYYMFIVDEICKNNINIGTFASVNMITFSRIPFPIPPTLAEQQKIANCLSEQDKLIDAQGQKVDTLIEKKKGLIQQLFPQPGETTPRLRFPGFVDDWDEKKLSDVFDRLMNKNSEDNKIVLTISAQYGLISQLDFFKKSVSASDVTGYYLLHKGDFAYNKSSSQGKPVGAIKPLKLYDKGVVSTLYICFRCKDPKEIGFWEQYFDAGIFDKEIMTIAQEGARNHGLLNVPTNDFFGLCVKMPKPAEQQKIAECLTALDELITSESAKLDSLKDHKKGLMQQLFPQPSK